MSQRSGIQLAADVERFAGRFLAFPSRHHLVVVVLWALHTWALSAFYVTPRLVLDSPEPGSGKTRVLEVLALLCRDAKLTLSTSTAALYRRIADAGDSPPTILQDETDAIFGRAVTPQAEDLRALFNSGYKRGATVDRCEGDAKNMRVREFPVFAPVALAGLAGRMPRTITDRAISLHMRRRSQDEHVDEFRERDAAAEAEPLRQRIAAWADKHLDALKAARPTLPGGVRDRDAEVWEALIAVADLIGGDWPNRAREACKHFVLHAEPDDKLSRGVRLLRDIKELFGDRDRLFSVDIVSGLTNDAESEWRDLSGMTLDQLRLAKELKRYGVRSEPIRIGDSRARGYTVAGDGGLAQAWGRYLPDVPRRDTRDKRDIAGQSVTSTNRPRDTRDIAVPAETRRDQCVSDSVTPVTAVTPTYGLPGEGAATPTTFEPPVGAGRCDHCGLHAQTQGHREDCHANKRESA